MGEQVFAGVCGQLYDDACDCSACEEERLKASNAKYALQAEQDARTIRALEETVAALKTEQYRLQAENGCLREDTERAREDTERARRRALEYKGLYERIRDADAAESLERMGIGAGIGADK